MALPTITDFRNRFPELSAATDVIIRHAIADEGAPYNETAWGADYSEAVLLASAISVASQIGKRPGPYATALIELSDNKSFEQSTDNARAIKDLSNGNIYPITGPIDEGQALGLVDGEIKGIDGAVSPAVAMGGQIEGNSDDAKVIGIKDAADVEYTFGTFVDGEALVVNGTVIETDPMSGGGGSGVRKSVALTGTKNGTNRTFTVGEEFENDFAENILPDVYHNGRRLTQSDTDNASLGEFYASESGGLGTGFDTINFITFAPISSSDLRISYTPAS